MAEFKAAKAALTNAKSAPMGKGHFLGVTSGDVEAALHELEGKYFLGMTAESERAMRIHLTTHFPAVRLTQRDGFGRLVAKCAKNLDPGVPGSKVPPHLVADVKMLTDYRNDQAHSLRNGYTFPNIQVATSKLSRFLYVLP